MLLIGLPGPTSVDLEDPVVGQVDPGHSGKVAAAGRLVPVDQAVVIAAIAETGDSELPEPVAGPAIAEVE